jgi:hypothetical protein
VPRGAGRRSPLDTATVRVVARSAPVRAATMSG